MWNCWLGLWVCVCVCPLSCLQYGISFGDKKPDNVDRYYIVLLSNLIEEGTVQCSMSIGVARSSYRQHCWSGLGHLSHEVRKGTP